MLFLRAPFISFVLTTILMGLFYGDELSRPNQYYLSDSNEGLKNYYSFAYHQQYDSTFDHFGGMAYPYGEHIAFTGGQPALALIIWPFKGLAFYSIALINLLLLLGVGFSAWILCKLLIRLGMTRGGSLFTASSIALLSPQIMSFTGQYSLAYCFIIPWILYTAFIFAERPSLKRNFWVFLLILIVSGLHLSYFLMAAAFIAFYYLIEAFRRKNMPLWKYALAYVAQVIFPFLLYTLWINITDTIPDRPYISYDSYDLKEYKTIWESLFLPYFELHESTLLASIGFRPIADTNIAYVGIPATLYGIYFILSRVRLLFVKKTTHAFLKAHSFLVAGFLVLLVTAAIPFLLETTWGKRYGGPLHLGAFGPSNWVFYYCLNLFMFLQLAARRKKWGMVLSAIAVLVLFIEGLQLVGSYSQKTGKEISTFLSNKKLDNYKDHVLFPLPYFYSDSEYKLSREEDGILIKPTLTLSLASGIPSYANPFCKTSRSQSLSHLEMAYNLSGVLMNDPKPWLILHAPSYQNRISKLLPEIPTVMIDTLELYSITSRELLKRKASIRPPDSAENRNAIFYYQNFASSGGDGMAKGKGGNLHNSEPLILYSGPGFADSVNLSFWLNAQQNIIHSYRVIIENTQTEEKYSLSIDSLYDNVFEGYIRFHLKNQSWDFPCRISIEYYGSVTRETLIDECIIYKNTDSFYYSENDYVFTNEFMFTPRR